MGIPAGDNLLVRKDILDAAGKNIDLIIVHPLCVWNYDKKKVEKACVDLGWKPPDIADRNSTNCLLNSFAIDNHIKKYGIHPYAFDLAALVRGGHLSREEAICTINADLSPALIQYAKNKLSITNK